jgi:TolB-like protein/tetratricopeptide (TPR) repeat protein
MTAQFAFGDFVLDTDRDTLERQGIPVAVGYRGAKLLGALVRQAGAVVPKADLIEAAWPGVMVEEGNLHVQIAALRKLLGAAPDAPDWIVTVPRVGYRFAAAARQDPAAIVPVAGPSIAVVPFANLGDDPAREYFADGLAEDLITRLARLRWLFVSGRNSSFGFRGRHVGAREIGLELGVRYVLDGSVRGSGSRLRVVAELADCATGGQVWSQTYDVELADFLHLQDQIAESVIAAIEPRIHAAEHARFRGLTAGNLDAWGFVMKAMPGVWTWGSAAEMDASEALLRRAIEIDPDYPRAASLLAWIHAARFQLGWAPAHDGLATALGMAQRAIRRDPADPWAHLAAGYVHMVSRSFEAAVGELGEAIELNPSFAFAHVIFGSTYGYGGLPEDGLHHLALATQLSPRDFAAAANHATAGLCHFVAGRYDRAVSDERRAVELRPHFGTAWRTLAAAAGLAGDRTTAGFALAEAQRLHPSLSLDWIVRHHPIVRDADRARYADGLRAAGLQ